MLLLKLSPVLALVYATTAHTSCGGGGNRNLEALFRSHVSPSTEIASSYQINFSTVVGPRWSTWEAPAWSGAIKPALISDLKQIIKIAAKNNIPFIATNGGHGAKTGLGSFDGININLQNFNTVTVDAVNNRMTLGPGATLGAMVTEVFAAGKEIQTGNSWCPGGIGVTLGGGIGMLMGLHGLMIDDLQSVELLTASGETVTASKDENEDLFWGIRGAGQTFGIVTAANYTVHDQTNGGFVTEANFYYTAAQNRSLWELIATFDNVLPAKLSLQTAMLYNATTDTASIWLSAWYVGSLDESQPYLDQFAALGPFATEILNLTQVEVYYQSVTRGVCGTGHLLTAYTMGVGRTDPDTLETHFADFVAFSRANPAYFGQSYMQWYSNKVNLQTPADSTVFPWRDVQAWWLLENIILDDSLLSAVDDWSVLQRGNFHATSGFDDEHVYVNYAIGDEGPAAWWSEANLPKLRALKARWDPHNLFGKGYSLE
ncbi:hypothetical protein NUW58_g2537 [Xylaria curta]|uniref:Uncharacterized protein n=1 Tax=Xylaria curta TaxID=42375 RepID=A0ACC1PF35_9PEZI|nr:hypothetical protein NUW58_g2537 [Xylaria curta]